MNRLLGTVVLLATALSVSSAAVHAQELAALLARADSLRCQLNYRAAKEAYGTAVQEGAVVEGQLGLATVAIELREWSDASRAADRALDADSASLEAHYLAGIALRELARIGTIRQGQQLDEAESHFRRVIAGDSAFRDVWTQAAMARLAARDIDEAARLALAQVAYHPTDAAGQIGLFRVFRQALARKGANEAIPWLESIRSEVASFFLGEIWRTQGRIEEAEVFYRTVLSEAEQLPRTPVLLALARIAYARDDPQGGQDWVETAVREIDSEVAAAFVFEDFKYVFTDEELAAYRSLGTPEAQRRFFETFWYRREPVPTSGLKLRLAEHYRRLLRAEDEYRYSGVRSWHQLPDKRVVLAFPRAYYLNDEFNDKGLVFLRYGEPVDRIVTVGGMDDIFRSPVDDAGMQDWLPSEFRVDLERGVVESWRYVSPDIDLHFMRNANENAWFLVPTVSGAKALEDREIWGGAYARLARVVREQEQRRMEATAAAASVNIERRLRDDSTSVEGSYRVTSGNTVSRPTAGQNLLMEIQEAQDRIIEASQRGVSRVMTTERHSWPEAYETLDMPFITAAFRGDDGQTRLELHYALPLGVIYGEEETSLHRIDVEVGFAVHDTLWRPVQASVEVKPMPAVRDRSAAVFDFVTLTVPPDSYQVAVHARPLLRRQLAGYRFGLEVPDFSGYDLTMSDLLPAYEIRPNLAPSRFNRNALYLRVNPFLRAKVTEPLYVYFEIYNLALGTDERTRFEVDYRLEPLERGGRLRRLFTRGSRPSLSLKFGREGDQVSQVEWAEIDVGKVAPGRYTLEVVVLDRSTGRSVSRSRQIELVPE